MRRHDLELLERAVGRLLVGSPSTELRRVTEAISLHVVVGDFNHQLRTQRFPREVLPLAPAALPTWHTACAFTTIFIRPGLPRMVLQRICPIRLEEFCQL